MKYKLLVLLTLVLALNGSAQRITPGQLLPQLMAENVLNYRDSVLNISDFKGKLIVFDFWNQGCLSCIKAFPSIERLQKLFAGRVQIILVNVESRDSTVRFFARHPKIKMPPVPFITSGEHLWQLFTKSNTPFHAWIGEDGILRYVTETYNLTEEHLNGYLAGLSPDMANIQTDPAQRTAAGTVTKAFMSSFIAPCSQTEELQNKEGTVVENGSVILSANCASVVDLYRKAFEEYDKHHFNAPSLLFLDVKDTFPYVFPGDPNRIDEWKAQHSYSYRLQLPASKKEQRYEFMKEDLKRYFGLRAHVKKRSLKCLALVKTGSLRSLKTKHKTTLNTLVGRRYENDSLRYLRNYAFQDFFSILKTWIEASQYFPMIDKTGCGFKIDLVLSSSAIEPLNLNLLRQELNKYNLDIVSCKNKFDVLVLTE